MNLTDLENNIIKTSQLGYYKVDGKIYLNKHQALTEANRIKKSVTFHWFDDAFSKFDRTLLGKRPLNDLYKERALQLRDEYDYLILNYSGGCDSYNILRTFLDNNIKLDQVMVCWPFEAGKKVYTPNNKDKSAGNFMSEWDFATRPDLEWLSKHHPEIKIELIDWSSPFLKNPNLVTEASFDNLNHFHNLADLTRSTLFSEVEEKLISQGKKVATIWGLDKPFIFLEDDNTINMTFDDSVITVAHPAPCNPYGTEYFYWTPKMPILAFEMAYQTALWFKSRPGFKKYLHSKETSASVGFHEFAMRNQINQMAARDSCYTTWNGKFQVNKPMSTIRADKDFWLYQHPELKHHVEKWRPIYNDLLSTVDNADALFDRVGDQLIKNGYKRIFSKLHYVCNYDDKLILDNGIIK